MSVWDLYDARMSVRGETKRETAKIREERLLLNRAKDSLSFHSVTIDGVDRNVTILNSDNLNEKTIISLPHEDIKCGALVHWMDNYWLVTERDANTTLYAKAKLLQCNYLLKWVNDCGQICEQWCIVEDGTKYLTGEMENRDFIMTRGDSRIAITISRNEETCKLNRENRFIVDDPLSTNKLSYILSKPLKIGHTYNDDGVFSFVLQEVVPTDDDNFELSIADYYKHFPKDFAVDTSVGVISNTNSTVPNTDGRKVWL